jgi:hypothetical protein
MNNEKYMLIKRTGLKMPLKSVDGEFKIKSGRKVLLTIHPSTERLFIYWIYGEQKESEIAIWLRECWDKNITPMEIDEIIDSFKKSHPAERIENFPLEDIPLYASEGGLALPMPGDSCIISLEDEKELISFIYKHKAKALPHLQSWFQNYREKYGLDYSKHCQDQQDFYLAESFLQQHGLCIHLMTNEELQKKAQKEKNIGCSVLLMVAIAIVVGIYLLLNHYGIFLVVLMWCCIIGGGLYFILLGFVSLFVKQ